MTRNRATKQAARTIATTKDIRMPDASYQADHRKLLLLEDEPLVYDFSNGPLRFYGDATLDKHIEEVAYDADKKGWRIDTLTDLTVSDIRAGELRKEPALLVVNLLHPYSPADLSPAIVRLIEGGHPELNVLVGLHADEELPKGMERGRNNRIDWYQKPPARANDDLREALPTMISHFVNEDSGLVLIAGPARSGRTTTAAALTCLAMQYNRPENARTIAITDPHKPVPAWFSSSGATLVAARNDTDRAAACAINANVIYLDEISNPETFEAALDAALAGALVFTTIAGRLDAAERFLENFPESRREAVAAKISKALRGVVYQTIVQNTRGSRLLRAHVWTDNGTRTAPREPLLMKLLEPSKPALIAAAKETAMLRVAFARRYADMLASGMSSQEAIGFVAEDMESFTVNGVPEMVLALRHAHKSSLARRSSEDIWGPHQGVLGRHLVRMLVAGGNSGETAQMLRQAAETLEADVRVGLA